MKAIPISLFFLTITTTCLIGSVDAKAFATIDKDGDGKVSHKEYVQFRLRWFVQQDKNRDQYLDATETNNQGFIMVADTDKDGRVSMKEAVAQYFRAALRFDTDGDGFLTFEELNPNP
jgi:Ca2+-binding EF-hand superfamily protein